MSTNIVSKAYSHDKKTFSRMHSLSKYQSRRFFIIFEYIPAIFLFTAVEADFGNRNEESIDNNSHA
jgi:hypothetical protein